MPVSNNDQRRHHQTSSLQPRKAVLAEGLPLTCRPLERLAIADAIRHGLYHWEGLGCFLDDGRIEIDSNVVERPIRPIALNRKNALLAGSDEGHTNWAIIASLIETCKLKAVNPHAWFADTLKKLVNRWPASRIDDLMPWAHVKILA